MASMLILSVEIWWALCQRHEARARARSAAHEQRRKKHERHAVEDFLWEYYPLRPGILARWNPGATVAIQRPPDGHPALPEYEARLEWRWHREEDGHLFLDLEQFRDARARGIRFVHDLARAILSRTPKFSCFGWHEWCMVYGGDKRHDIPLRLGQEGTDQAVEAATIACTHYDAFRFFTDEAVPHNTLYPTREKALELEQGGCLHANMDVLKWCLQLGPAIPGDLLLDAYDLARDIRWMDMAAAAYDLSNLGVEPIRIETPQGRSQYAALQKNFAARAKPLRERLLALTSHIGAEDLPPAEPWAVKPTSMAPA